MGAGGETSAAPEDKGAHPFPSIKGQALRRAPRARGMCCELGWAVKRWRLECGDYLKTAEKVQNEKSESPGLERRFRLGIGPLSWAKLEVCWLGLLQKPAFPYTKGLVQFCPMHLLSSSFFLLGRQT